VQPTRRIDLAVPHPGWLTAGAIRLGVLGLFIVLVEMVRIRLTPSSAGWAVLVGALATVAGGGLFLVATRRIARRLPLPDQAERVTDAVFVNLRRIGLPLLGLAFFLVWAFVYIGVWWAHPEEAFRGLEAHPRFADFFYASVSTAFISPPGDILAHSRGARSATMIEMLTGFALVAVYLSSFVDWAPRPQDETE
jgi:hypothetical protein